MTTTTLLILGASGDLTKRLLLPGVGSLLENEPDLELKVAGADRVEVSAEDFSQLVRAALSEGGAPQDIVEAQVQSAVYRQTDVTDADQLRAVIDEVGTSDRLVIYFALPPAITERACHALLSVDLPDDTHLALEKPFGHDQASAEALNALVARLVPEHQIHRVDHFLGKSTVINILALRFANSLMQAVWSADQIESIQIHYDEPLALEGRAGYYDKAGALEDMIQSHLLQVMAIVMMEPPATLKGVDLRDATAAVLRSTRLWGEDAKVATRRGRYTAGTIGDRTVPNYVDEQGVDPSRKTETLAQITVEVVNQRWAGVPVTLRSGKALGQAAKQIIINFRDPRHIPYGLKGYDPKDQLIINLSPDTLELRLTTNGVEDPFTLEQSIFTATLGEADLAAYGEVLLAVLKGESLLSVRGDAAEACWRITDKVLAAWRADEVPIEDYEAGLPVPANWAFKLN